jgi:prepilin-type processing-associated H-X9-DG protein
LRKRHPGGINVATCDGAAQFLGESIAADVFRAMITEAGGEAIQLP